jgi:dCMP deaminase
MKAKMVEAYMETAQVFANCSTAKRLKVGAIIVDPDTGAIISVGYNGTLPGASNECEEIIEKPAFKVHPNDEHLYYKYRTRDDVLHAEENAIAKLAKSGFSSNGSWMFLTHSPCIKCARLLVASGVSRVFYKEQFNGRLGCGLDLLKQNDVTTYQVK